MKIANIEIKTKKHFKKKYKKTIKRKSRKRKSRKTKPRDKSKKRLKIKAKGKSIKGNRQLSTFLKNQGTLSYKLEGKDYSLKIDNDIIERIDSILKDELDKQKNNKKHIINKLKSFKKILKDLLNNFNDDEELIDILEEINKITELSIENFQDSKLENIKIKVTKIKNDIVEYIERVLENQEIAMSNEQPNNNNNLIQELEELSESINNLSPK